MARRTYTDAQKADALALYATDGPTAVQERMGISKGTVASWAHRNGVATVCTQTRAAAVAAARVHWDERRQAMIHKIGEAAELALDRTLTVLNGSEDDDVALVKMVGPLHQVVFLDSSDAKALATTMAILVDKAQVLSGAATERIDHRHTTPLDEELASLFDDLEHTPGRVDA